MGARISMQFVDKDETSPVLFSHWGGESLKDNVDAYMQELTTEIADSGGAMSTPLSRMEVGTVMVDFIRYLTKDMKRVDSDLYLTKDESEGDNSDYGHFTVDISNKGRKTFIN